MNEEVKVEPIRKKGRPAKKIFQEKIEESLSDESESSGATKKRNKAKKRVWDIIKKRELYE